MDWFENFVEWLRDLIFALQSPEDIWQALALEIAENPEFYAGGALGVAILLFLVLIITSLRKGKHKHPAQEKAAQNLVNPLAADNQEDHQSDVPKAEEELTMLIRNDLGEELKDEAEEISQQASSLVNALYQDSETPIEMEPPAITEDDDASAQQFTAEDIIANHTDNVAAPIPPRGTPPEEVIPHPQEEDEAQEDATFIVEEKLAHIDQKMHDLRDLYKAGLIVPELYILKTREYAEEAEQVTINT